MLIKLAAVTTALAAALGAGTLTAASTASAAPSHGAVRAAHATAPAAVAPRAAYNNACGAGYSVIDQKAIASKGTVYLTYNSSNGYNCVVTIRNTPGAATYMYAYVAITADPTKEAHQGGEFTTYAGPVYLYARGQCIDWEGQIYGSAAGTTMSHCG